jgi:hypothetical protein
MDWPVKRLRDEMMKILLSVVALGTLAISAAALPAAAETYSADIVVYGGTAGGIAAAVQASRDGKTAILLEFGTHLGGLSTGGLGATDIGNKAAIGGIAREFYERICAYYAKPEAWKWTKPDAPETAGQERSVDPVVQKTGRPTKWTFEPHVAMDVFKKMLA